MGDFERWKHYIGCAENQRGEKLTEEQLRRWADDPDRKLGCVFCQVVGPPSHFHQELAPGISISACPRCREYKGIQPHIPGWSDFE